MATATSRDSGKGGEQPSRAKEISPRPELDIPGYWETLADNCTQWADEVSICQFWKEFEKHRRTWSNEFFHNTGGSLLARDALPKFRGKRHERIQAKIAQLAKKRKNAKKTCWEAKGPPVPKLNDLVRTRVECKFVDGVEFIGEKLLELGQRIGVKIKRSREGRLEGYFAQHLYFDHEVFFRFAGVSQQVTIKCEVQVATQLATRVWNESHETYEKWRGRDETRDDWQWNPKDPRFIARQLGHMIHLADGLLVQLRDAR